ncbi:MAG: ORF6N domain-containing protein [bacterium]
MKNSLVPIERIEGKILVIRNKKVMLDKDLAELYGVKTSALKRQVNRNIERFPEDFMFQLTKEELENLRCHFGISSWGGVRHLPYAFTEQGVAMLSSVLNSKMAVKVNIQIMRAFVRLREMVLSNEELRKKVENMEKKYDQQFKIIFDAIKGILSTPVSNIKKIGFREKNGNK